MTSLSDLTSRPVAVALVTANLAVAIMTTRAQDNIDEEFVFASKLVEIGFADYAERMIDQMLLENPALKERARVVQIEILGSRRKFDDAEKLLRELPANNPKTEAARLALANHMYRHREIERARKLYQVFFSRYQTAPTDPDLRRFYMDAAYRFGQMLLRAGDREAAITAFENILKAQPERGVARRVQVDLCQLLIDVGKTKQGDEQKKLLDRAWKLCEEIQWGKEGIDVMFCQSIAAMANIEIVRGRPEAAIKLLRNNMDLMKGVDEILRQEKLPLGESPMAYARFLLGQLYEQEAEKRSGDEQLRAYVAAVSEYANVFGKYPDSEWAPEAGARTERLIATVQKKFNREIRIDWGAHMQKAVAAQQRLIDDFFLQKKYAEAASAALKVINAFPKAAEMGSLLTPLLISWAEMDRRLELEVAMDHIRETRTADVTSGLALLALGKHFFDKGDTNSCVRVYKVFADAYPKHERTPQVLFLAANMLKKKGDTAGSRDLLKRIIDHYPQDQFFLRALNTLGWERYEMQDYEGALEAFMRFVKESPPSHNRALALFSLADCQMRLNRFAEAAESYQRVIEWLSPRENNPYAKTTEEVKKAAELVEKARFYVGYCRFKQPADGEEKAKMRAAAVAALESFVQDYKTSDLAPKAINLVGAIQLELGRSDEAAKTFERLGREYPNSEDGKSALFSLIRAAVEIARYDIAEEAFSKLMAGEKPGVPSKLYTPEQFVRMGQWFLDGKRYPAAVRAFEKVLDGGATDRALLERSLYGLGVAAYEAGQTDKAIEKLEDLMTRYPRTGLFYEARTLLSKAYRKTGKFPEAIATLNEIFKVATDPVVVNQSNLELAKVYREFAAKLKAENKTSAAQEPLRQAAASYERIILLADETNERIRPMIEEALRCAIDVHEELERYADAIGACDRYLEKFGDLPAAAEVRRRQQALRLKAAVAEPAATSGPVVPAPTGGTPR